MGEVVDFLSNGAIDTIYIDFDRNKVVVNGREAKDVEDLHISVRTNFDSVTVKPRMMWSTVEIGYTLDKRVVEVHGK